MFPLDVEPNVNGAGAGADAEVFGALPGLDVAPKENVDGAGLEPFDPPGAALPPNPNAGVGDGAWLLGADPNEKDGCEAFGLVKEKLVVDETGAAA